MGFFLLLVFGQYVNRKKRQCGTHCHGMMRKPESMKILGELDEGLVCWGLLNTIAL